MFSKDKVTEIFCTVDDFCKEFELRIKELRQVQVNGVKQYRNRHLSMSDSEILAILIMHHIFFIDLPAAFHRQRFPV